MAYGTYTALDVKNNRISIEEVPCLEERQHLGVKYHCESCGGELIAKTGSVMIHHFAHKNRDNCDSWSQPMSEWHRKHQEAFPKEFREVIIRENNEWHRADILLPPVKPGGATVIEFQHSPISVDEFAKRNRFYTANDRSIWWVFDWHEKYYDTRMTTRWGRRLDPDDIRTGMVYFLEFERKLASWTDGADAAGVKVALQLSCGDRDLLFIVSEFGYDTATGTFIETDKWRESIMGDWHSSCEAVFDKTAAGADTETVYGAPGDVVDIPAAPDSYRWMLKNNPYQRRTVTLTYHPIHFRLSPLPKPKTQPSRKEKTANTALPAKLKTPAAVPTIRNWDFSSADAFDACKGYCIYLPKPSASDGVFHLPVNNRNETVVPKAYYISQTTCDAPDKNLPCRAVAELARSGEVVGKIAIVLFDGEDGTEGLEKVYDESPGMSLLAVDVSGYKGPFDKRTGLLRFVDYALARNIIGGPQANGYRQWLYNDSVRRKQDR